MAKKIVGYDLYLKPHHPTYHSLLKPLGLKAVPITSDKPTPTSIEGLGKLPAYRLDIRRLDEGQRATLIASIAATFRVDYGTVLAQLFTVGLPVLQRDCEPPVPVYAN